MTCIVRNTKGEEITRFTGAKSIGEAMYAVWDKITERGIKVTLDPSNGKNPMLVVSKGQVKDVLTFEEV